MTIMLAHLPDDVAAYSDGGSILISAYYLRFIPLVTAKLK
jgi:hypothetical protein